MWNFLGNIKAFVDIPDKWFHQVCTTCNTVRGTNYRVILTRDILWQNQFQRWTPFIRFNSFRLLSLGICCIQDLRRPSRDNSIYWGQYFTCYSINLAWLTMNSLWKLNFKIAVHKLRWRPHNHKKKWHNVIYVMVSYTWVLNYNFSIFFIFNSYQSNINTLYKSKLYNY